MAGYGVAFAALSAGIAWFGARTAMSLRSFIAVNVVLPLVWVGLVIVSLAERTPGAVLHLLHIVERPIGVEAAALDLYQQELAAGCWYLDETARSVGARSEFAVVTDAPGDAVADAILGKAASLDADLILVGTSDPKPLARWLLGSVAEEVMRKAGCGVLIVRPKHHDAAGLPVIEAPCAGCAAAQEATHDPEARCAQHAHPLRQHLHYEMPQGYGAGSMFVRP